MTALFITLLGLTTAIIVMVALKVKELECGRKNKMSIIGERLDGYIWTAYTLSRDRVQSLKRYVSSENIIQLFAYVVRTISVKSRNMKVIVANRIETLLGASRKRSLKSGEASVYVRDMLEYKNGLTRE